MLLANIVTDFTEWLDDVASHWWFLFVIFGIALLDSVIPAVPSETAVILGGIASVGDGPHLLLVIIAGAAGAFCGDNLAYELGHRFRPRVNRYAERHPKFANRIEWARGQIRKRGGPLLVTARFIPGGRTAMTITSGITDQPRQWFVRWIALAAVVWASYAAIIGAVAKDRFKDDHTLAFLVAFGTALGITALIEVVRHFRGKRDPDDPPSSTVTTPS